MYWWDQTLKMEVRAMASMNREAVLRQAAQGLVEDLSETKERTMALESKVKYLNFLGVIALPIITFLLIR